MEIVGLIVNLVRTCICAASTISKPHKRSTAGEMKWWLEDTAIFTGFASWLQAQRKLEKKYSMLLKPQEDHETKKKGGGSNGWFKRCTRALAIIGLNICLSLWITPLPCHFKLKQGIRRCYYHPCSGFVQMTGLNAANFIQFQQKHTAVTS